MYNGSFTFDGLDDFINVLDSASLTPGSSTSLTISLWARPPNINQNGIMISKRQIASPFEQYAIGIASTSSGGPGKKLIALYRESAANRRQVISSIDVTDGEWHHFVAVMDESANNIKLYSDAVQLDTVADIIDGNWPTVNNPDPLRIGNDNGVNNFNGSIDEVIIWNRSLSAAEITELYNKGRLNYVYTDQQNLTASNENTTFTISNNTEIISPRFKLYSTSILNPFYTSLLQHNIIYDFYQATVAVDSCTYTSGNWDITCSDNWFLNIPHNIDGNFSLFGNGNITLNVIMNFTGSNKHIFIGPMCELRINSGGGFN